jgi:hypothetical protein
LRQAISVYFDTNVYRFAGDKGEVEATRLILKKFGAQLVVSVGTIFETLAISQTRAGKRPKLSFRLSQSMRTNPSPGGMLRNCSLKLEENVTAGFCPFLFSAQSNRFLAAQLTHRVSVPHKISNQTYRLHVVEQSRI